MVKTINVAPNPVLTTKAVECPTIDKTLSAVLKPNADDQKWPDEILELVNDLKETAESLGPNCAGLAANQIWDKDTPPPAVFVVKFVLPDTNGESKYYWQEFINPKVRTSGNTVKIKEACFSKPGYSRMKNREANVTITMQTLTDTSFRTFKIFSKETFSAIAIQHEYDHIQGKLI